jgi:hypothetical protein
MLKGRLAILAVAVIAVGAYTMGPAIAGVFTKAAAKKIFVTKKGAKKRFARIGDSYTKAESDAKFAQAGNTYTKAEADGKFAPASDQVKIAVPPNLWANATGNDADFQIAGVGTGAVDITVTGGGASINNVVIAHVPLALSGPATLVDVRLCGAMSGDTTLDSVTVRRTQPTEAAPNPAAATIASNDTDIGQGASACRTVTAPMGTTINATDVLSVIADLDWADSGLLSQITSTTVTIQT